MILIAMREEREEEDVTPMRFHHPDNLCKGEGGVTLDICVQCTRIELAAVLPGGWHHCLSSL